MAPLPALSESQKLRFFAFTLLYLAQGLPWGFISVGYIVFLADLGLDNTAVGDAMAWAYLPWSFKILAGPLLDLVPATDLGRRRPFIIGAEFLMGGTLAMLLLVDPATQLTAVSAILFLHNCAAALQDVAVDAMAVDLLEEDERGRANSFMWAGKSAGVAIAGGSSAIIAGYVGWSGVFALLALSVWAIMAVPLLLRENPPGEAVAAAGSSGLDLEALKLSFGFFTPWAGVLVALLTPAGYALVGPVFTRMLRADLGLSDVEIGMVSFIEPVAGVAGALIGGFVADRLGTRRVMGGAMFGVGIMLAVFGFTESMWTNYSYILGWVLVFNLCIYAFNAASLGFFMSMSNPAIGATQFAMYMAATNLTFSITSPLGGRLADAWGVAMLYSFAAVVQIISIGLLPLADPAKAIERFKNVGAVASGRGPTG